MQFSWKKLVGSRLLVNPNDHDGGPREYRLIEVSPSGEMLKFENGRGKTFWCPHQQYTVLEDLGKTGGDK